MRFFFDRLLLQAPQFPNVFHAANIALLLWVLLQLRCLLPTTERTCARTVTPSRTFAQPTPTINPRRLIFNTSKGVSTQTKTYRPTRKRKALAAVAKANTPKSDWHP